MKWRSGEFIIWLACVVMAAVLTAPLAIPVAAQQVKARPSVARPDGEVWQVIRTNCITCHGIDDYAYYALDRKGWQQLIKDKHQGQGPGDSVRDPVVGADLALDRLDDISDKDMSTLLDWLAAKFGPNTKPFPRAYVPVEITTFFTDPEGYSVLNRACTACHDLDRVTNTRNNADGWRVTVLGMRGRGATISDDEIEHLVEWLGRVLGKNQDK